MKIIRTSQIALENNKLRYNKALLLKFCDHFRTVSLEQLLNDKTFINLMHNYIHGIPTLQCRAFQLALEMTYSRRKYDSITLQQYYENDFLIKDVFNTNKGVCDQSTVYTAILTKHLTTFLSLAKKDVVVNSTPIYPFKDNMSPELQAFMEYCKKMTGNSCPDILLMERPFDYKDTKDFSYSKNHLYIIDKTNIAAETAKYLYSVEAYFKQTIKQHTYDTETTKYMKTLLNIIQNNNVSKKPSQETYENILTFMLKKTPPKEFKMAVLVYGDKFTKPDVNLEESSNVCLDSGILTDVKVKKAIYGIMEPWSAELKETVHKATHASLSFILEQYDKPL